LPFLGKSIPGGENAARRVMAVADRWEKRGYVKEGGGRKKGGPAKKKSVAKKKKSPSTSKEDDRIYRKLMRQTKRYTKGDERIRDFTKKQLGGGKGKGKGKGHKGGTMYRAAHGGKGRTGGPTMPRSAHGKRRG
jgi:hypothetical protein